VVSIIASELNLANMGGQEMCRYLYKCVYNVMKFRDDFHWLANRDNIIL
jgi:hypothetical protein